MKGARVSACRFALTSSLVLIVFTGCHGRYACADTVVSCHHQPMTLTANWVLQEKTVELRDQVVDKGGIALVRLRQNRALPACPCSCIVFAALSTVLQHSYKVELANQVL